jgi:hypothetical protein
LCRRFNISVIQMGANGEVQLGHSPSVAAVMRATM